MIKKRYSYLLIFGKYSRQYAEAKLFKENWDAAHTGRWATWDEVARKQDKPIFWRDKATQNANIWITFPESLGDIKELALQKGISESSIDHVMTTLPALQRGIR
jgi:hypothetical protein